MMNKQFKKDISETANAQYINKLNSIKVLDLVRNADGISRADIAKKSGLSAPTASRIVKSLIDEGLIHEVGIGISTGGRRPTLLKFSGDENFIIGIDLGTTNIYGVLTNLDAKVRAEAKRSTHVEEGFYSVMERTSSIIDELKEHLGPKQSRIFGIGMAVAGLINRERNIVEFSPDFHWHNVDILGALTPKHKLPIIFDNVTRVMALGELHYGVGREYKNFVCVNVGYGIGGGIVIDGKPLYGPYGMAGELGHITLDKDSLVQCDCGNFGCLEALASGHAIARAAQTEMRSGAKTLLTEMGGGTISEVSAEMVANAAKKGDSFAWNVFDKAAEYLGLGIAALINLFSPEAVVIGGGVSQVGDILFDKVRKTVNARALNKIAKDVVIRPATFGMKAAVMGAVSLILSEALNLNHRNVNILNYR
jgi:glucokinase-like ROK family protein